MDWKVRRFGLQLGSGSVVSADSETQARTAHCTLSRRNR